MVGWKDGNPAQRNSTDSKCRSGGRETGAACPLLASAPNLSSLYPTPPARCRAPAKCLLVCRPDRDLATLPTPDERGPLSAPGLRQSEARRRREAKRLGLRGKPETPTLACSRPCLPDTADVPGRSETALHCSLDPCSSLDPHGGAGAGASRAGRQKKRQASITSACARSGLRVARLLAGRDARAGTTRGGGQGQASNPILPRQSRAHVMSCQGRSSFPRSLTHIDIV